MNETVDVETEARNLGWAPKEEFRGDPEKWIDAQTFVKRGHEIMPILRENNRRLEGEVQQMRTELASARELLKASAESIEELKNFNSTIARERAKGKKAELAAAIAAARADGDVEGEIELQSQLNDQSAALREAEATKEKTKGAQPNSPPPLSPDLQAWLGDNKWFGVDKRRTALANGIADELRAQPGFTGLTRESLDGITREVERIMPSSQRTTTKVGDTRPTGDGGGSGKSYADLPPEAKDACERSAKRLVGAGKAYKTNEEWRKKYVSDYFAE